MSGFGGGFGQQSNVPPFGTPAQQQQQNQFGSGFGTCQPAAGFGSGFGTSPSNFGGFGNTSQQQPQQQASATPFGATQNSFAGSNTASTPFGNTSTTGGTQFGTVSSQPAFGTSNVSSGFNTSPANATGFATTPAQTPFGQQQSTNASSFGNTTAQPFGSNPTTPFGTSGGFNTPAAGPFGSSTAAPSSGISFGVSSNIAPTSQGFGTSSTNTPFSNSSTTTTFGTSSSTVAPAFASSSMSSNNAFAPSTSAFGGGMQASDDKEEEMMDGGGDGGGDFGTTPSSSATPFGASTTTTTSSATEWVRQPSNTRPSSSSQVPNASTMQDSSMSPTPNSSSRDDALRAKKEEIKRKKKKLEELKRRKEAAAASSSSLNASAPSFVPTRESRSRGGDQETPSSLADRNAARFAKPDTSDALLPEDLRNRQGAIASGYKDDGGEEAQDFDNAVSLVGTCPYMCPDDELIRRQNEGDIQLLETPQPGSIHPADWTLRDTAVKRFRRSAADYKLDVPEWVRPPDVLETVCGYLEEWVMERDRQGPDPRFPQSESPPSLDVYQFIWDRTRMVRKDFTLQNYVGTGGQCDAAAVRCHERIARWHAMCEHQLSHIEQFVNAQSQQNIQELGQAMKTLNHFYDDSLGRSTVEVPDEDGNETRTDLSGTTHGCKSQLVQGADPVDFDGTPLKNDNSTIQASKRIIGPQAARSPAHGTAEPEMRGLFILLTMDNDGGMEVLKFASSLHSKKPEIYSSRPVQLAMQIFKTKKDNNYAKFFSLLRDPATPYLFACIMFKHVEIMRRAAFRTMSRTYGGVNRKTKQALEDQYPLKRLVHLLCFEDEEEALEACRHYSITVEIHRASNPNSPASSIGIVYWRRSSFREPRDPEKGFTLPLKPRKMIRTIESKLKGATRLAVCRGEVSGEGAALASVPVSPSSERASIAPAAPHQAPSGPEQAISQAETDEQAAKRRVEERRRLREERKKMEEEKRRLEEIERKEKEEAHRQALLLKKQKEEEAKRERARAAEERRQKQLEEQRRRKLELEEAKRAAEAAAREEQLRREAGERRLAEEKAAAARKAEAERQEILRQEELRRIREEEERLERIRREEEEKRRLEEERIRQEQERLRQEQLRVQREREEQERKMREEEARRIAEAKEAAMNEARKLLIWRRLRSKVEGDLRKERTRQSLARLDPTWAPVVLSSDAQVVADTSSTYDVGIDARANILPGIQVLDRLSRHSNGVLDLSAMLRKAMYPLRRNASSLVGPDDVMLIKVAVVLPAFVGPEAESIRSLVHAWIRKRLQYGSVVVDLPGDGRQSFEIRTVASPGNGTCSECDVALLVIPPYFGAKSRSTYSAVTLPRLDGVASRAILCLDGGENQDYAKVVNKLLASMPHSIPFFQVGEDMQEGVFDLSLEQTCDALLQSFVSSISEGHYSRGPIIRLSIALLASRCIRSALWSDGVQPGTNEEQSIMNRCRGILDSLLWELKSQCTLCKRSGAWSNWPAREFVNSSGVVPDYFGDDVDLPADWKECISGAKAEAAVMALYKQFDESSFLELIDGKTIDAPQQVKQDCREMLAKRQFRRCLEYILLWEESNVAPSAGDTLVYLPKRNIDDVVEGCIRRIDLCDDDDEDFTLQNQSMEQLQDVEEVDENAFGLGLMQVMQSPHVLLSESSPRTALPIDGSRPLAELSRSPDNSTMSPPVGVQTPSSPPVGVQTPSSPPLGVQTPATATVPTPTGLFGGSSKRLLDSADASRSAKRRRDSPLSKNQKDSMAFTQKLESMLHGETVADIKLGDKKLAELLQNAPRIELP